MIQVMTGGTLRVRDKKFECNDAEGRTTEVENVTAAIAWLLEVALPLAIKEDAQKDQQKSKLGLQVFASKDVPPGEIHFVNPDGTKTVINNVSQKEG